MNKLQQEIAAAAEGSRSLGFDLLGKEEKRLQEIPIANIQPDPNQPRRSLSKIDELAASIKEQGLLQPIVVSPVDRLNYRIVMGERRYTACQKLGMEKVPAVVMTIEDRDRLSAQIVENLQREDLDQFEEAQSFQLLKETLGLRDEDVAKRVGKARTYITKSIGILRIPETVRDLCRDSLPEGKRFSRDVLEKMARQKSDTNMQRVFDDWISGVSHTQRFEKARVKPARSQKNSDTGGTKPKKVFPEHQGAVVIVQSMTKDELTPNQIDKVLQHALEINTGAKLAVE